MVVSAFVYALFLGPWFAIGLMVMLFIHEMGHIIALKIKGYPAPGPVFIPMLGAVIFAPKFKHSEDEAFIGYGGPLLGGIAAVASFGLWALLPEPSEVLLLVSYIGIFLNLFNMLPIRPLDGGRITQVIGGWFKYLGLVGLLFLSLYIRQPGILLIWILVLDEIKIQPWLKFGAGVTCQIAMMTLFYMGFGEEGIGIAIWDSALAAFINFSLYIKAKDWIREDIEEVFSIKLSTKMKWLGLYAILLIALTVVMIWQAPYLPEAVRK